MYNWTPQKRESAPNMQLDELIGWLTVVDSLAIKEQYKDEAYKGAFEHIAETIMVNTLSNSVVCTHSHTYTSELFSRTGYRYNQRKRNFQHSH